jgi:hypothetical protein
LLTFSARRLDELKDWFVLQSPMVFYLMNFLFFYSKRIFGESDATVLSLVKERAPHPMRQFTKRTIAL